MVPPVWTDDHGQPLPTRPCPRCGAAVPIRRYRPEQLKTMGWELFAEVSYVNWCGHLQDLVTMPYGDGEWWLMPVLGEVA
jgi:hypothetical protein